mmetsp:Transcript_7253/g.14748  ORF Transcript_7253/g.14748 Transcript_7253/m.14748 type:complete len:270 (+) Transcript_7253:1844-2653(+)
MCKYMLPLRVSCSNSVSISSACKESSSFSGMRFCSSTTSSSRSPPKESSWCFSCSTNSSFSFRLNRKEFQSALIFCKLEISFSSLLMFSCFRRALASARMSAKEALTCFFAMSTAPKERLASATSFPLAVRIFCSSSCMFSLRSEVFPSAVVALAGLGLREGQKCTESPRCSKATSRLAKHSSRGSGRRFVLKASFSVALLPTPMVNLVVPRSGPLHFSPAGFCSAGGARGVQDSAEGTTYSTRLVSLNLAHPHRSITVVYHVAPVSSD